MTAVSSVLSCDYQDDGVATVTLNRPEARNALSAELRDALSDCLDDLARDETVDVVLLTGAGDMFCAGFDLKELSGSNATEIFAQAQAYHRHIYTFAKPLVAVVNGPAMAGGMDLAAMCDVRIAADSAVFGQPQVRMGIPAAYDLMRTVMSESMARRLCLTGERIDAATAADAGFLSQVVSGQQLMDQALAFAGLIAGDAAVGAKAMKAAFVAAQPALFGVTEAGG